MPNLNSRRAVLRPASHDLIPDDATPSIARSNHSPPPGIDGAHLLRMVELLNQVSTGSGEMRVAHSKFQWKVHAHVTLSVFADSLLIRDPNDASVRLCRNRDAILRDLSHGYLPATLADRYVHTGVPLTLALEHAARRYDEFVASLSHPAQLRAPLGRNTVLVSLPRSTSVLLGGRIPPSRAECSLFVASGPMRKRSVAAMDGGGLHYVLLEYLRTYLAIDGDEATACVQSLEASCKFQVLRHGAWCTVGNDTPLQSRDVIRGALTTDVTVPPGFIDPRWITHVQ
jgi:hypothetical protein